ncbi:MAG TPA: peptidoglycan recognition family protein [Ktedonobacteraceae bacterium]|nr:peptidoglycan recognition family protein [Ktedonobacteraceae bacterium]
MKLDFDRAAWESQLCFPDWYVRLEEQLRSQLFPVVRSDPDLKRFRHQVYELVEALLEDGTLPLAQNGPEMDEERKPLDTIVIHHTTEEPDIRLGKLSAIGLVRQYAFQYLANNVLGRPVRGQPIWSGHFRQGKMVFFAYHWLIRPDGKAERLLEDSYIGWHAGNWDINTRSIGIAFSGDYEDSSPPAAQIAAAARLARTQYPQIARARIFGHHEIAAGTTCPGAHFLHGWKYALWGNR